MRRRQPWPNGRPGVVDLSGPFLGPPRERLPEPRPWRGTLGDVKHLVERRVRYRPNFDLFFDLEPGGRNPRLRVMAHVQDTYDPAGRTIIVTHTHPFPVHWEYQEIQEKHVIGWLFDCLKRVEFHECSEWFRLDGEMLYDPHA